MSFICTQHICVADNSRCAVSSRMPEEAVSVALDFDPDQQGMLNQFSQATSPAVALQCPELRVLVLCVTSH